MNDLEREYARIADDATRAIAAKLDAIMAAEAPRERPPIVVIQVPRIPAKP